MIRLRQDSASPLGISCGRQWFAGHQVPLPTDVWVRLPMPTPERWHSGLGSYVGRNQGPATMVSCCGMPPTWRGHSLSTRDGVLHLSEPSPLGLATLLSPALVMALKLTHSSGTSASGCSLRRPCTHSHPHTHTHTLRQHQLEANASSRHMDQRTDHDLNFRRLSRRQLVIARPT